MSDGEIGRAEDRDNPRSVWRQAARQTDWDPVREFHQGQRLCGPLEQAGHMTAPDQFTIKISLAPQGPSTHETPPKRVPAWQARNY
jgi:hypothetical protein